jgi:CRISPR-associated protein Cas1
MQLVINSPGTFITQKDECFRLKQKERVFDVSPLKVESIVISNQAMISSQAVVQALEHNIDIIFLDSYGDPLGRIWFAKMGSTALIRRKQLVAASDALGVELTVEMIRKKMDNQISFLKRLMHARPGKEELFTPAISRIDRTSSNLDSGERSLEGVRSRIMGLEGTAGRAYFQCLSKILPEKYQFERRSRRPAKDPFNAVLNYCYGILYSQVEKACILSGLDPYVGFLHADNYNKKSMVFDLIEPFRILVWILYDIIEDQPRNKVAKQCKKYGLARVQKSVFLGQLESNRLDELSEKCLSLIDEDKDSVYLFPFCQEDFRRVKVLGQGFDRKLVNDEILAKFF